MDNANDQEKEIPQDKTPICDRIVCMHNGSCANDFAADARHCPNRATAQQANKGDERAVPDSTKAMDEEARRQFSHLDKWDGVIGDNSRNLDEFINPTTVAEALSAKLDGAYAQIATAPSLTTDAGAAPQAAFQSLRGWKIERTDSKPFKRITITAPNGHAAVVDSLARNPENILYMLADALLAAPQAVTLLDEQREAIQNIIARNALSPRERSALSDLLAAHPSIQRRPVTLTDNDVRRVFALAGANRWYSADPLLAHEIVRATRLPEPDKPFVPQPQPSRRR